MVHCIYPGATSYNFQMQSYVFLVLANRVDTDEMPPYAAFPLGLHRLPEGVCVFNTCCKYDKLGCFGLGKIRS